MLLNNQMCPYKSFDALALDANENTELIVCARVYLSDG